MRLISCIRAFVQDRRNVIVEDYNYVVLLDSDLSAATEDPQVLLRRRNAIAEHLERILHVLAEEPGPNANRPLPKHSRAFPKQGKRKTWPNGSGFTARATSNY